MFGIIDRFEENFAVVELDNNKMINISTSKIPQNAKVGDVLSIGDYIVVDYEQTEKRKKLIEDLSNDMWN